MQIRRWLLLFAILIALPNVAAAVEPKCPLELATCLGEFERMHKRPWFGIGLETDSLGRRTIETVQPGSPAARAGLRPGDVLQSIEGKPPGEWFAGKAGWKNGDNGKIAVLRNKREKTLDMKFQAMPEEVFARIIGVHMIEGHMAYMHAPEKDVSGQH